MRNELVLTTAKQKKHRSMKAAKITSLTVIHVILTVMALVWILPFAYVFIHSFRGNDINIP